MVVSASRLFLACEAPDAFPVIASLLFSKGEKRRPEMRLVLRRLAFSVLSIGNSGPPFFI